MGKKKEKGLGKRRQLSAYICVFHETAKAGELSRFISFNCLENYARWLDVFSEACLMQCRGS